MFDLKTMSLLALPISAYILSRETDTSSFVHRMDPKSDVPFSTFESDDNGCEESVHACAERLLTEYKDRSSPSPADDALLHLCCRDCRGPRVCSNTEFRADVITELVSRGADVNAKNRFGDCALSQVPKLDEGFPKLGGLPIMKVLVENGADINAKSNEWAPGATILMTCIGYGRVDMIEYLLCQEVDVNALSVHFETALTIAAANDHQYDFVDEKQNIMQLLLDKGADISAENRSGETVFHKAGNPAIIQFLASVPGAPLNSVDRSGRTILTMTEDNPELQQFLQDRGADLMGSLFYIIFCYIRDEWNAKTSWRDSAIESFIPHLMRSVLSDREIVLASYMSLRESQFPTEIAEYVALVPFFKKLTVWVDDLGAIIFGLYSVSLKMQGSPNRGHVHGCAEIKHLLNNCQREMMGLLSKIPKSVRALLDQDSYADAGQKRNDWVAKIQEIIQARPRGWF